MPVLAPDLMRARVLELERAVDTLTVRVSQLQHHVAGSRAQSRGARLWPAWDWKLMMKKTFTRKRREPVRENRRVEAHDDCSTGKSREQLRGPMRGLRSPHGKTNPVR